MKISKVFHKGENRIMVEFAYNKTIEQQLRTINDARWSKTLKAWHIPYGKAEYSLLKQLFPDIGKESATTKSVDITDRKKSDIATKGVDKVISVEVIGRKIILKMPKNIADVKFITGIRFSSWNQAGYYWQIPHYPGNLEIIKNYFGARLSSIIECESTSIAANAETRTIKKDEVLIIKTAKIKANIWLCARIAKGHPKDSL